MTDLDTATIAAITPLPGDWSVLFASHEEAMAASPEQWAEARAGRAAELEEEAAYRRLLDEQADAAAAEFEAAEDAARAADEAADHPAGWGPIEGGVGSLCIDRADRAALEGAAAALEGAGRGWYLYQRDGGGGHAVWGEGDDEPYLVV